MLEIDWTIILPALAAGICVLLSHVPLGQEVLKRGIIFIDLAVAQFAGLGLVAATVFGAHLHNPLYIQLIAFASAISGAFLLNAAEGWFAKRQGDHNGSGHTHHLEAFIGICFVLAATGSILLLSREVHGGQHLKDLLVGQILWTQWTQLLFPLVIGLVVFIAHQLKPELFAGRLFYILFALAITASVQLVGVYLVFASLIIPALAVYLANITSKKSIVLAFILGVLAYFLGLLASSLFDLPAGAVIVWVMAVLAIGLVLFSPTVVKS